MPLGDDAPPRPLPDFPYGFDKYLSEQMIEEFILGPDTAAQKGKGVDGREMEDDAGVS